jgi:phosphoglycolate phosphatase
MKYEIALFDLDGTLTDPGIGITKSVAYALKKFGIEVKDLTELYKFIGPPLIESFERFYGFSHEDAVLGVEYYREYFSTQGIFENKVYDGIEEMLTSLKESGCKLIVATSKPEVFAVQILEHFKLDQYFSYIAGANMDETRTKKDEVIEYAIEVNNIADRSKVVMIGDREHDIMGAKKAGLHSIGVLYGYGDRNELANAGADDIVEDIDQIKEIILS